MARLVFGGDDVSRRGAIDTAILSAAGDTVTVYTSSVGSPPPLANIVTYPGGSAIAGSTLTVDTNSQLPLFQGPNDGTDTLYVSVNDGPITAIYARVDDRLDALAAQISACAPAAFAVSGLPSGRFVGVVAGTAPTGGPYLAGDYAIDDATPSVWVCTTAGSPGTWRQVSGGGAAGVASFNTRTGAVTLAKADVTGTGLAAADVGAEATANKGSANGYASLDSGGKVPTSQLPALAITDTFVVASQAAMLALTAQRGDVAIRTDSTPNVAYILTVDDPTVLANWQALDPATTVTSVNGATGAVTVTAAGLGALAAANNLSDVASVATARTNLGLGSAATHPSTDFAPSTGIAEAAVTGLVTDLAAKAQALTRTAVKTASYTAAAGDLVPVDTTASAVTVTLPNAPADKSIVCVKHIIQGGTNAVTVACGGSDVFNRTGGVTTLSLSLLAQGVLLEYTASAAVWTIVADDIPLAQLDARFQPLDGDLTAIAALTTTTFGRSVLDRADAAALRTLAGLGSLATLSTITSAEITDGTITDADVAAANKDGAAGTASLRTLGDGTAQASQGSKRAKSLSDVHADAGPVNTVSETTMLSLALPSTLVAGDVVRLVASGDLLNNSGGAVTYTAKLKVGSTAALTSSAVSIGAGAQRRQWWLDVILLVVSPSGSPDQRIGAHLLIGQTQSGNWPIVTTASANAYLGAGRGVAAEDLTLAPNLVLTMTLGTANALADFIIHDASLLVSKR